MAADINAITIVGRLTKEPEMTTTSGGTNLLNFTLANNGRKDDDVSFIDAVCFGKAAEIIVKYCNKGERLGITGRLQQRSWTAKDGTPRTSVKIVVAEFQFIGGSKSEYKSGSKSEDVVPTDIPEDSEIPFNKVR